MFRIESKPHKKLSEAYGKLKTEAICSSFGLPELHGVTTQKSVLFIITAVRTSSKI
jgi:hypothetical protein